MQRHLLIYAAAAIIGATPAFARDYANPCEAFGSAEVIFVGRVKSAPITRRISGEEEIEKARVVMEAAERELKAFEALKMPPEIGEQRNRELAIRFIKSQQEWSRTRAKYPPPVDLSLTPLLVEIPFRGVTTSDLFMMNRGQPALDPTRSYLFYAERPMGDLAPDVIFDFPPKEVESAEADLLFLRDAAAGDGTTVVNGSLKFQDPANQMRPTPLPGVALRVSIDGQQYETSTGSDGTFTITGVPPGLVRIEPVLPEHLSLPSGAAGGMAKGGCLAVQILATLNGRIRGRVLMDDGTPFRGLVDVVSEDPGRRGSQTSPAFTNERGEFTFSALPPGPYLVGVNIAREPTDGSPFRPTYFPGTTDRSDAIAVVVGPGTEHSDLEWVVASRLRIGTIEVSLNSHGQAQKQMGICVTMLDADNRNRGGVGYERTSGAPLIVKVVEGVKYRLVAWGRTPSGFAESEIFDVIGAPGHRAITLEMTSLSETATGTRCLSAHSDTAFSPR